jgi:hypothetical protein
MAEDTGHATEQQHRHQPPTPVSAPGVSAEALALPVPTVSFGMLGDPRLSGRGNGPVRAAVVQRMQQSFGNRATGRMIQRMVNSRPLVAVQRDDDDEEEQNADQQDNADLQAIPPAPNRPLPPLPGPQGRDRANAQAIPNAPNRPLPPLPDTIVAELQLAVDVESKDPMELGLLDLVQANVGHAWVTLAWHKKAAAVPDTFGAPTKMLLTRDNYTSMGFWPLIYRAEDWTAKKKQKHEDNAKLGISPGHGASENPQHDGFSIKRDKYVPGRVEEPDLAHGAKAMYKFPLTLAQVTSFLAYVDSKRDAPYNLYDFNCTTFALEATEAAGQKAPSAVGKMGMTYPNALYAELYKMLKTDDKKGYDPAKGYLNLK